MRLDHAAHPCRDPAATHRFYTEVLGLPLLQAWAGDELLLVYPLPGGGSLAFSARRDEPRPTADGVAWERRHVGLTVGTRAELDAWQRRLAERGVAHRAHDDGRLYFADPDGLVLELEVAGPQPAQPDALEVLKRWSRGEPA